MKVLWRVGSLLGNDDEISKYSRAVTKRNLRKERVSTAATATEGIFYEVRAELL